MIIVKIFVRVNVPVAICFSYRGVGLNYTFVPKPLASKYAVWGLKAK